MWIKQNRGVLIKHWSTVTSQKLHRALLIMQQKHLYKKTLKSRGKDCKLWKSALQTLNCMWYYNFFGTEMKKLVHLLFRGVSHTVCYLVWKLKIPLLISYSFNATSLIHLEGFECVTEFTVTNRLDLSLPPSCQTELTSQRGKSLKMNIPYTLPYKRCFLLITTIWRVMAGGC